MRILKNILIYTFGLCLIIYLSFLFILPNFINSGKYSKVVEESFLKQTGYNIRLNSPKVSTSYNLNMTFWVDKANIFFENEKFAQINNLKIKISLLPLIFKKVKISDIKAEKLIVELPKSFQLPKKQKPANIFFDKLPNVNVDYLRVSLKDGKDKYSIKGNNLCFSDNPLVQKMNLSLKGIVLINDKENVRYDVNIIFKLPEQNDKTNIEEANILEFFRNLKKYSINSDLIVRADVSNPSNIKGKIDISGFTFVFENKKFPASFANLQLDKNNIRIKSDIFTSYDKKISFLGDINYGTNKNINLNVLSDEIELKDLFLIAKTVAKSFGLKQIEYFDVNGLIKADFNIKSNLKNINSKGNLIVKNAKISNGEYSLDKFNSVIDFSGDSVKIVKAKGFFKENPINIIGQIDTNANADISLKTESLKLRDFVEKRILQNYIVEGNAYFEAFLKGNLKETKPKAIIIASKVGIKDKKTGLYLKNNETKISVNGQKADIVSNSILINDKDGINSILLPKVSAAVRENVLEIDKGNIWIDNVKAEYTGKISNILSKPFINGIHIVIPTQNNLTGPNKSKISINGDLTVNGDVNSPKLKGNVNISKLTMPMFLTTLKNVMITADDSGIKINCPYVEVDSSVIRLNAFIDNILSQTIKIVNINADYIDIARLKKISQRQNYYPNIQTGTLKINKIKNNDIIAENIVAKISEKDNILYLKDLTADAYSGKIKADITQNILKNKTSMTLQGRGIDSYNALLAVSGKAQDIHGRCDFDSKLNFTGDTPDEIQKTLKGEVKFQINNFISGNLGKLDYLIQAQNILSNRVLQSSLNIVKNALKIKDLGVYNYAQGEVSLDKETVFVNGIKLAGPATSLYIKGRFYPVNNNAFILISGRVSDDIVTALGPIGNISNQNSFSKAGSVASAFISDLTTTADVEDIENVPELTVKTNFKTQEFKVLIKGDIERETSVKTFKWIKRDTTSNLQSSQNASTKEKQILPSFIENLPDFKQ